MKRLAGGLESGNVLNFERVFKRRTGYPQTPAVSSWRGCTRYGLSGGEAFGDEPKYRLVREGAGEEEANAAGVAHDDGADF